jgi:hypothetical protein
VGRSDKSPPFATMNADVSWVVLYLFSQAVSIVYHLPNPNVLYVSIVEVRCAILLAGVSLRFMGELNVLSIVNLSRYRGDGSF